MSEHDTPPGPQLNDADLKAMSNDELISRDIERGASWTL